MADPVCSAVSLARAEPLYATASMVRTWLLVEHPGAWGPAALHESGLPIYLSEGLAAQAREYGFRVLLLRRPARPSDDSRQVFLAHSGRHRRWIEQRVVDDLDELLDVDYRRLREGRPLGWGEPREDPLYLVCTNGRHDPCCANLGRPVARALHARADGAVWESSHYGGDRFAGNLVCLPHGLYYGRLSPEDAERVVDAYERGAVDLENYRGRAGEPFAAQAAEHFLRRAEDVLGVDDVVVVDIRRERPEVTEVTFDVAGDRRYHVRVQVRAADEARPLSCGADVEARPPTYELLAVDLL